MGRKDYNKGMEAGARPFEDKFRQEQKRNQEWKQTFEEKFDHIKETNEAILDEMDSMQKKQFFKDTELPAAAPRLVILLLIPALVKFVSFPVATIVHPVNGFLFSIVFFLP